jgi:hypothetical protein
MTLAPGFAAVRGEMQPASKLGEICLPPIHPCVSWWKRTGPSGTESTELPQLHCDPPVRLAPKLMPEARACKLVSSDNWSIEPRAGGTIDSAGPVGKSRAAVGRKLGARDGIATREFHDDAIFSLNETDALQQRGTLIGTLCSTRSL